MNSTEMTRIVVMSSNNKNKTKTYVQSYLYQQHNILELTRPFSCRTFWNRIDNSRLLAINPSDSSTMTHHK